MNSQNYPWLPTLLSYFKTIKKYDTQIESYRSSLCSAQNFSPLSIFSFLDKDLKSFLTVKDLKLFLESQNTEFNEIFLRKLIHNFDKDNDFSLNLHEFSCLILSKKKNKNEIFSNSYMEINDEIRTDLKNILEKEMELINELNDIAIEIKKSEIFSTYEAFIVIVGGDKYITKNNLGKFLNDNYMEISDEDVSYIMFRIDADNDDKISYEEFKDIFYPLKECLFFNNNNISNNDNYNKTESNKNYNFNDINITNKYISNGFENEKNLEDNNENEIIGDYKINEEENKNKNNNNFIEENKGKKKKITKKVILRPKLESNLKSNDEDINSLHTKNLQNPSYENINNNYILKSKCKSCAAPKKETIINSLSISNKYINEENNFSLPKSNNIINKYDEEEKINNINLRKKPNKYDHDHKGKNCKACLYTAQNIYNDYRNKNTTNSPLISPELFTFRNTEENEENNKQINNDIGNDDNNIEESKEETITDIYKNKEELLKKYGIINTKPDDNNKINSYNYTSQKKTTASFNIDNYSTDNEPQKIEKESISNINRSENKFSSNKNNISTYHEINNSLSLRLGNKTYYLTNNENIQPLSQEERLNSIPKNNINEKKELLYKLLVNIIEKESNIEKIKLSLSENQDITPKNIFKLFNPNNKFLITSSDVLETLNSLESNNNFAKDDLKYIFKKFNKTTSNGFTFDEVCKIIFPKNYNNNNFNDVEITIEENSKNILIKLFKEIIEGEKEIENDKILLDNESNNIYYDLFEGFKKIDKNGIQNDDIEKFMKEYGYDINENHIDIIMERIDKNKDGLIDYGEFISEIRPMNFC